MKGLVLVFFLLPSVAHAVPPWAWSLDNRLAARVDAGGAAARVAAIASPPQQIYFDNIEGSKTPELLLPTEVWTHFLTQTFETDIKAAYRRDYRQAAVDRGLSADLWTVLQPYADRYVSSEQRMLDAAKSGNRGALLAAHTAYCRERAATLRDAVRTLGEEPLMRFLYEVVAPKMTVTIVSTPRSAAELRAQERGCQ